jgi:hypothetical protein
VDLRSLQYAIPRSQSPGRPCAAVCASRITCADAVAKLARDRCCRGSLLHGCYAIDGVVVVVSLQSPGILSHMEAFITSAAAWTAAASWATFLVLALTLYFVYRQVAEATTLRRDQTRPYVVVSIDVEQRSLFMLTVENVGSTPAFDVVIKFDKPLRSSMKEIEQVRMLQEAIPMLPPSRRLRAFWEDSSAVFKDDCPYPLSYQATVKYKDQNGRKYGPETYVLDFRMYEGLATGPKGINELVNSVEKLCEVCKKTGK